jgi:hypothetical protein
MAARFYLVVPQILTDQGRPLAGGKIDFYENGTTTPKNTWSDSGLSVLNANPVVIGADGRVPDIFANASDVFSVRVTDANDNVVVATVDDVSFVSAFSLASADVLAALSSNAAAVVINGSQITGSAFAAFADNLDLTAAGSIDASAGTVTLGTVNGTPTFSGLVTFGSNLVSDTDSTDDLGTTSVRWLNLFVDKITLTGGTGGLVVDDTKDTGILDAYGHILTTTTVDGNGIASVSNSGTGVDIVTFDNAADSTGEQTLVGSCGASAVNVNVTAVGQSTTSGTFRQYTADSGAAVAQYPVQVMRALFT